MSLNFSADTDEVTYVFEVEGVHDAGQITADFDNEIARCVHPTNAQYMFYESKIVISSFFGLQIVIYILLNFGTYLYHFVFYFCIHNHAG